MNFRALFQDFNASKFVVFSCLLAFSLLFALKLDGELSWSWWSIFIPLWVWKGIAGKRENVARLEWSFIIDPSGMSTSYGHGSGR